MSSGIAAVRAGGVSPRARLCSPRAFVALLYALLLGSACSPSPAARVRVATTTSVENSGLLEHLRLAILQEGIALEALAVGSGKALALAREGSVDLAITHDPDGEAELANDPRVIAQRTFLENRFIIVGPEADPAGVGRASTVADAFQRIHASDAPFASRGDESGTHAREMRFWRDAGIDPRRNPEYRSLGQGMSMLLRSASELGAYALTDDATFASVAGTVRLVPLAEGGEGARNVYSVTLVRGSDGAVDPAAEAAFAWLTSEAGAESVRRFLISGRPAFRPVQPSSDGG